MGIGARVVRVRVVSPVTEWCTITWCGLWCGYWCACGDVVLLLQSGTPLPGVDDGAAPSDGHECRLRVPEDATGYGE